MSLLENYGLTEQFLREPKITRADARRVVLQSHELYASSPARANTRPDGREIAP